MAPHKFVRVIIEDIEQWEGITVEPHRFGGQQFNLGNVEIGHIHNHGMVDIPFTRRIRAALVGEGLAQPHHLLHESGWITFYVRSKADTDHALWLYRLSMLQKQRGRARKDPERLTAIEASLRDLHLSNALTDALGI